MASIHNFISQLVEVEIIEILSLLIEVHFHSHGLVLELLDLVVRILFDVLLNIDLKEVTISSRIL